MFHLLLSVSESGAPRGGWLFDYLQSAQLLQCFRECPVNFLSKPVCNPELYAPTRRL